MIERFRAAAALSAFAIPLIAAPSAAQQSVSTDHEWCDNASRDRDRDHYCEVREFTLPADRRLVEVDGGPNGGIRVEGWERNEIRVLARVQGWDRDRDEARAIVGDIEIVTRGPIRADGPRRLRRAGWSVSYRLMVPRTSDLSLETVNGGIDILDVSGDISFRAVNGGIGLERVSGDVRGGTTNGGIEVALSGGQWEGRGLDVETTNGGIRMLIPEDYRARLETGTVNGGFRIDFPITIQGRITRRRITTDLNGGGPTIRAVTTNGGVVIRRS
jgi:hypothetical protein